LLGFSEEGSIYLNSIKKDLNLPLVTKYTHLDSIIKDYELKAASIYEQLTNEDVIKFELNNKPLKKSY
ncbi:MAG: nucleotidyltransferase family protein, partial [Bacilli bacterium]|nr:nucleotidyltransferase family protein [Bacilli bacterium]